MTTLIITRSDDNEGVAKVIHALKRRGGQAFRFDTDRFPTEVYAQMHYDRDGDQLILVDGSASVNLREVTSVWYRRLNAAQGLPQTMVPQFRHIAREQSRAFVLGLIASLEVFHLDAVGAVRFADHKPVQLQLARRLGLDIPRTLITNDPAAVPPFAARCAQGLITKLFFAFAIHQDGRQKTLGTSSVEANHLQDLDGLPGCPMIFQEEIPKRLELRVTIVGDRLFAAAVDSQRSPKAKHDWRRDGMGLMDAWTAYDLPDTVAERLLRLVEALGLNYAAVDLILTPEGRYVFLEINPVGEFYWLERTPGFPISSALADVLLGRTRRRHAAPQGGLSRPQL